jgi:methionyl-tRNA formyltransferase
VKILFLGYSENETTIIPFLISRGHTLDLCSEKVSNLSDFDLVISFGYKKILTQETLSTAKRAPINLHISFLPFNRGMHPNFWAHYEGTPSGVTIHHIDDGIDTGDIVFQRQVEFHSSETTFKETWVRLKAEIEEMFMDNFENILKGEYQVMKQEPHGTFHSKADLPKDFLGWDCEITTEVERLKKLNFE